MTKAAKPENELDRLKALQRLEILDSQPEERYDRITRIATQIFGCTYSSISLIDAHRQWFKSGVNLGISETHRDIAFCAHTITTCEMLVVPDTLLAPDFAKNPLVTGPPHVRFYAGVKVEFDGYPMGALCVFDDSPRQFSAHHESVLRDLGKLVEAEFERESLSILSNKLAEQQLQLEEKQKLTRVRSVILEQVVNAETLSLALHYIVEAIESEYINQRCSILLLKGNKLRMGAAPSLPDFYNKLVDGIEIGIGQGSCGTAAFTNKLTIAADISQHPYWEAWRDVAKQAHLGSCWSQPICGVNGEVFGTFAVYHDSPAAPSEDELIRIQQFAHIASIAIEREQANEVIWRQANYDVLTGLPNRNLMEEHLKHAIKNANRSQTKVAVMLLDLDNFKDINDTLGHDFGDKLLIECGRKIQSCIRQNDTVARLGGDEFVLIFSDVLADTDLDRIIQCLLTSISSPQIIDQERIHTSVSIGVTIYPDDANDVTSILKNADQAMYGAKALGKNSYYFYTKSLHDEALKRLTLLNDLRYAIENEQLYIEYQPIINLQNKRVTKAEALIRWQHPTNGLIRPDEFIPIAEESGLIIEISNWVFQQVCDDVKAWRERYCHDLQLSINTSPSHYFSEEPNIMDWLNTLLASGTPSDAITLEITESLLMDADDKVSQKLFHFRQAGVSIALDDFGTGYSSISYLKKYPTDYIKIDRSFVHSMTEVSNDKVLCEAIILMAKKLGIEVVAEGIETKEQLAILTSMGCHYGQGYLFAKPLGKNAFEAFLGEHQATNNNPMSK
ncbi:EAL domain-containing protein [Alteromonas sp. C1M14]|uniref:sensor domain-containing phosphodiesterase n=1 Tax=Alteromonas sp. C1M14 TaxID=2841567 RepID=UPI001C0A5B38|nr:EAL domain-containing protein [Alteromonas sp. C1M14]MBU2978594.1 EAL domain-containing protein [Alteromonas sp. C1M14]